MDFGHVDILAKVVIFYSRVSKKEEKEANIRLCLIPMAHLIIIIN